MARPKKNSNTRYSRARPVGLRSTRVARVGVRKKAKAASRKISRPAKRVSSRYVPASQPPGYRTSFQRRQLLLQQRTHTQRFLRHALQRTVLLVIFFVVFGAAFISRAEDALQLYLASPLNCSGWKNPAHAILLDAASSAAAANFTDENSATIQNRKTGAASDVSPVLKCSDFTLPPDFPGNVSLSNAQLLLSMAIQGNVNSSDVLVVESSLDGKQWTKLDSFFLTEDMSNAAHGGYWSYPFPLLSRDTLSTFQIRVRLDSTPSNASAHIAVDGLALAAGTRPKALEKDTLFLPVSTTKVEQGNYTIAESPVVDVQVAKQGPLHFLGIGDTKRQIISTTLVDPAGNATTPTSDVQTQVSGSTTYAAYHIKPESFTKPGRYTLQLRVQEGNKVGTVTQQFLWGVLVINTTKATYHPGETATFAMGVLDPDGHTICDADVTLVVTEPFGTKKTLRTGDGTVKRSTTCGPDNVTDVPDYTTEYDTSDEGTYKLALTAITKYGILTTSDQFPVKAVVPFDIVRHAPTRINPTSDYTIALEVKPQRPFTGVVTDQVPATFKVYNLSEGGYVEPQGNTQLIHWLVKWPVAKTRTLSYRVNFPDVSPELFRIGPAKVSSFTESRQWQIASDAVGAQAPTRLWMTGFEQNTTTADMEYTANVGSPTIDATTKRSGSYSLHANPTNATQGMSYNFRAANDATGTYVRVYVYFAALPSGDTALISLADSTPTSQVSIKFVSASSTLQLFNEEDAGNIGSVSTAITTGVWYRLELRADFGTAATGDTKLAARLDGVEFASSTTVNWQNGFMTLQAGILAARSADMYVDDIAINVDSTNSIAGEGWPGAGSIVYLRPNGDGTNQAWLNDAGTACSTGGVDCSLLVDEVTPDDGAAADDIKCSASQTMDFTLQDATTSGIDAKDEIRLVMAMARAGTGSSTLARNYSLVIGDGATFNTATAISFANNNTTYYTNDDTAPRNVTQTIDAAGTVTTGMTSYDKPGTTTDPWTPTDVNGAQVRLSTTDCSPVMKVSTIWTEVEYIPQEGGRLWTSGFELQSVTAGVEFTATGGTAPTISTAANTFRSGAASLRTNVNSSTSYITYDFGTADITDDFYARAYIRMATRPSSDQVIMAFDDNAGTHQGAIRYKASTSTLQLFNEEDQLQVGSDSVQTIAANTWYIIELKINATTIATTGLTARLNGVYIATGTVNHANGVKTLVLGIPFTNGVGGTADMYFDDVALNEGMGVTQNSFPGPGAVVAMQPDSVGGNTAWNVSVNCVAVDYTCVDEVTPNDATDAVASTTLNQVEDNNFETSANAGIGANDSITLVQAGFRFSSSAATATSAKLRLKDGTNGQVVESFETTASTTTWTTNTPSGPLTYPITAYTQPQQETNWTTAALDAAQVGVRLTNDSAANFQVSTMWLMVEYEPKILVTSAMYQSDEATGANCQTQTAFAECDVIVSSSGGSTVIVSTATNTVTSPISGYVDRPLNIGDPVAIYVSGMGGFEIFYAATVVIASSISADITSNNTLYQNEVVLSNLGAVAVTNTLLSDAALPADNSGDVGMRYIVTSGALAVDSGMKLYVLSGKTFTAGGAVTTTSAGVHLASSAAFTTGGTTTIGGNLDIDASATMTVGAFDLSVSGTTGITGTMTFSSATGAKTLTGAVTINANGTWTNSGPAAVTFRGGLTNNSAASHTWGTVTYTFDTNDQNIGGSNAITMSTVVTGTAAKTLTNTGTLTISAALNGAGNFTNGASAVLNVNFTGALGMSGTFTANASNNTVSWGFGGVQTVSPVAYYNLTLATSGVKTLTNVTTIGGNLTLSGTASATITSVMTITLDIIAGAGTSLTIGASTNVNGGDIATTTSAVIASSGTPTVTISGTGTIGGGSGAITIYNLVTTGTGTTTWTNGGTNTVTTNVSVGAGTTLNFNSTITITGNLTNTTSGNIGTSAGTPTVLVGGATIGGGTTGSITFYSLTKSGSGAGTFTNGGTNTINNQLAVSGSASLNINSSISIVGPIYQGGGIGTSAGTPTITVSGVTVGDGASAGPMTFYRLDKSGAGVTTLDCLSCTLSITTNLNVTAGQLSITTPLTVTGNVAVSTAATLSLLASMNVNGGSVTTAGTAIINTPSANTLTISGTGSIGGGTTGNITLSSLTTTGSGTTTFTNGGTNLVNVNVSVGAGTTLNLNSTITIAGNLTNTTSGIIGTSSGTPTVNVNGTSIGGGTTGTITFYKLGKTGGTTTTWTNGGTNTVNNNLGITAGTLVLASPLTVTGDVNSIAAGTTLTINADLAVNGGDIINATTGIINTTSGTPTVTISTTGGIGGGTTGAVTFYNLATTGTGTTTFLNGGTNTVNNNVSVGAGTTLNLNSTIGITGSLTNTTSGIIGTSAGTPTVTVSGTTIGGGTTGAITFYKLATSGSGTTTFTNGGTNTVNNDVAVGAGTTLNLNSTIGITGSLTNATSGVIGTSAGTPTVSVSGTSIGGGTTGAITVYNLTKAGAGTTTFTNGGTNTVSNDLNVSAGTFVLASSATVSNTLTVAASKVLTVNSGQTLTHTGATLTLSGTVNGPGTLEYQSSTAFPTSGILALGLILRFNVTAASQTISQRADYQYIEIENSGATGSRTVTLGTAGSQTIAIANDLTVQSAGSGGVELTGVTNAPAVNVTGNVTCASSANAKTITTGAATWTVSGNFDMTNCTTLTATGNTLVMNGSGKTLTSNGQVLNNLTLSGTITLANAVHAVNGDLILGGTVTPGTSTVTMTGTSNAITGGGFSLYNLTIDPSSAGTITLQTSDLTVTNTLNVATGDALTINVSRTLTHTGGTLTLAGTINGPGTLEYQSGTVFPTGGILASALILRFNVTAASQTMSARADYQYIEIDNSGATGSRTVTLGTAASQTISIANNLTVSSAGSGGVTLTGATNAPDVNIAAHLSCNASANAKNITTGAGTWTVTGSVVMTNCTALTTTAGNTLAMNGSGKTLTTNGFSLKKLSFTGGSVTTLDAVTATDTFTIANGATLTQGANVNLILQGDSVSIANGGTFTKASGSGIFILDGVSLAQTFTDSNTTKQDLGTVQIGQSPSTTTLSSDMSASTLNIHTGDTLNTKGYDITVTNHVDCQGTCTLDLTDTAPNNETDGTIIDVGGNWTMSGTLTAYTNSTVFMNSTAASNAHETIITNGQTFYNFECKNAGTTNDKCIISGNLIVAGNLTLTDGALDLSTNNPNLNVAKNVTIASAASVTKGTGTWTFDGTTAATYTDSTATPQNLGTVVFNKTSGTPAVDKTTLASSMTVDTADIQTGDTLDLGASSYVLKLAKAGATATVLTVTGTLTPGTSTVQFSATNSGGNINVPTTTYSSLQFSGAETYDQTGHLTGGNALTGSVTIDSGATLDSTASNYNIAVGGSWLNGGTYTAQAGTVSLTTGNAATVSGSTTFNNFSVSGLGTAKTITFVHGTTQTVGTWTIAGSLGNVITLQRDNTSAWTINPTAATVDYATVSWSNSGLAICATHSTDGGNNNGNWTFTSGASCGIDISGTSNSSGGTVKVSVNSSPSLVTTTLAATWTLSGVAVNINDIVTVFVDSVADSAETTGVTKYDGTGNITGMVLDTNVLSVGSGDNASLTVGNLGLYDCDDNENIMHSANSSVLLGTGCANSYTSPTISVLASNTLTIGTTETMTGTNITNAGILVGTGSATFNVAGNWTNTSTFTANSSIVTFNGTSTGHTINPGASSFANVTFDGSGGAWSPLTNTLTATGDMLVKAGSFDTSSGTANVVVNGNVQCSTTCGTINLTSTNTFTQSVSTSKSFGTNVAVGTNWTFNNLTFTASAGTPTITFNGTGTGQTIVGATLSTTNSGTSLVVDNETNDRIIDANGAVTIGAGTTLQASSTAAFTVAGNWTNSGVFTAGTGTVTLDGGSQQTLSGGMLTTNKFNNLVISNASGSDPDTSPSVIFGADATTGATLTAATASTKLRFNASGTYTFQNISFNGQATGTRVALRSSTGGTQWAVNVAGTRTVSNTDVRDSNACGQAPDIDASDGTNADGGNNSCWLINTLRVSLSGTSAALGALDTGHVNQAGITSTVTSDASGGYISFVKYDHTLTSGSDTIADTTGGTIPIGSEEFGAASSQSGNTIAQWSPTSCATTTSTSNATALTTAFQSFASATNAVSSDVTTLCFLASIAGTTVPGSYTSTATLVTTARF